MFGSVHASVANAMLSGVPTVPQTRAAKYFVRFSRIVLITLVITRMRHSSSFSKM